MGRFLSQAVLIKSLERFTVCCLLVLGVTDCTIDRTLIGPPTSLEDGLEESDSGSIESGHVFPEFNDSLEAGSDSKVESGHAFPEFNDSLEAGSDSKVDSGSDGGADSGSGLTRDSDTLEVDTGSACLSEELCDGIDNDCDRSIDEGCPCAEGDTKECYSGDRRLIGHGKCVAGRQICDIHGIWESCDGEVLPLQEVCNGVDDDCDGVTDEDNPGGGTRCQTGLEGICGHGTEKCIDGSVQCSQDNHPGSEICDALDNDCDPSTPDGSDETDYGEPCDGADNDLCLEGVWLCIDGLPLVCSDDTESSNEICGNNIDEDCDGELKIDCCSNTVRDGSLELGTPSPYWDESSSNDFTVVCDIEGCVRDDESDASPRTGAYWLWFGGWYDETSTASQTLEIQVGGDTLRFYLAIPACDPIPLVWDILRVFVDGTEVFETDNQDPNCDSMTYMEKNVDISAWADGDTHTIEFWSYNDESGITNFMIDDISIVCSDD